MKIKEAIELLKQYPIDSDITTIDGNGIEKQICFIKGAVKGRVILFLASRYVSDILLREEAI